MRRYKMRLPMIPALAGALLLLTPYRFIGLMLIVIFWPYVVSGVLESRTLLKCDALCTYRMNKSTKE